MAESVKCPGCQAHLFLPSLPAEQTVQCPRCRHVFAPVPPKLVVQRTPATPDFDDEPTPDEPMPMPRPKALRGEGFGKAVMLLLALSVLSYGAQLCLHFEYMQIEKKEREIGGVEQRFFRGLVPNIALPAEIELDQRRAMVEQWENIAYPVHHATFWLATIVFLAWLYCASANAWNMHALGMYFVPETSAFAFLVPVVNLFWPYLVLQEIWRASDPRGPRPTYAWKNTAGLRLIDCWWLCFVAGMCLWIFRNLLGLEAELAHEPDIVELFATLSHAIAIVEGVLLILIIRAIMQRQKERYERLSELSA